MSHPTAADFAFIRHDARAWWHHRDLRAAGRHAEAARLERRSIASKIRDLRRACLVGVGAVSPWYVSGTHSSLSTTSGCAPDTLALFARFAPQTPRVDKRALHAADPARFARLVYTAPLLSPDRAEDEVSSIAYVTPGLYCAIWEALGATVHWGALDAQAFRRDPRVAAHLARMTPGEA
jgi:hypothetical protein